MKMMPLDLAQRPKPSRTFPVTEFHFVIIRLFFFFWYQASIQGASVYRKGFIKNYAWNTPTSTPPKGTFQLVSSGVSLMMGEDVLRGSLMTGGLSNRCPQRERLVAFLGTMYTKNNHLENLF